MATLHPHDAAEFREFAAFLVLRRDYREAVKAHGKDSPEAVRLRELMRLTLIHTGGPE